jgi:hypothetical protein
MTAQPPAVTVEAIAAAARLADLPLTQERAAAVADLLTAWVPAANALNARMRADELRSVAPPTTFTGSGGMWGRTST